MVNQPAANRRALVIGAGQIGGAVARELLGRGWSQVVLVTRTHRSATAVADLDWVRGAVEAGRAVIGHGDMLSGTELAFLDDVRPAVVGTRSALLSTVATTLAVDDVVDATNVATQLAGQPDHADLESVLRDLGERLINLNHLLRELPRLHYARVSTTGLGGLGLDLPFTHGDDNESVMSAALWRKLQISGVEHQALWALARSHPGRVHLVVPAAAVGFEDADPNGLVPAGEGKRYSLQEVLLMTHPAMMGAVTKEEVADAVADLLLATGTARDVLAAMQAASLGPSADGATAVDQLRQKLAGHPGARVSTGSLGPLVSGWIDQLTPLLSAAGDRPLGQVADELDDQRWARLRAFLRSVPGRPWADMAADTVDVGLLLGDLFAAQGRGRPQ